MLEKLEKLAKTLFTIDKPMSRLPYFKINMIMVVFCLVFFYAILLGTSALPDVEFSKILSFTSLIFLGLFTLVISIVLTSKRLWDIFDKKVPAIICAFIIYIVIFPLSKLFYIFKILNFIITILILIVKGKKRDKVQTTENKEEVSKEG